jgi:hypothetical protein
MFGWFRIPKRVVDGRAAPELAQHTGIEDVKPGVVVVVREDTAAAAATQRRLPDGRTVTYENPDDS